MTSVLVAVDAENISYRLLSSIDQMASRVGDVLERRVFGDFEMPRMKPWEEVSRLLEYEQVNSPHIRSKNIADMTMIIEIMESVYEKHPDVVVIGSGDGDFVPLVNKLRSKNIVVIGAGTVEASNHFKQACSFFRVPDDLSIEVAKHEQVILPKSVSKLLARIAGAILKDYRRHEWVPISLIGAELIKHNITLDLKNLGIGSLYQAYQHHMSFEIERVGNQMCVRRKALTNERRASLGEHDVN